MDSLKEKEYPNPRDSANIFSILTFWYTKDIFIKGMKKTLDVDDLYNPLRRHRSTLLGDRLERTWEKEQAKVKAKIKKSPSLLKAVALTFWREYVLLGLLAAFCDLVIRISQPLALGKLLAYYNPGSTTTKNEALTWAGVIILLNFTSSTLSTQYHMGCMTAGMKVRISVCSLIYRKAIKLSRGSIADTPPGKIVNMLASDVSRFDWASMLVHQLWIGPLSAIIIMFMLFRDAGWSGIAGVVSIFAIMPLQAYTARMSAMYRKQTARRTDERLRLMDEILKGMQVIKMYAWEKPFEGLIGIARKNEIKIITKSAYVRAVSMLFNMFTTRVALFATLLTMVLSGQQITAATVFVFMSYFNILSQTLAGLLVRGISEIAEVFISIGRIQGLLAKEEFDYENGPYGQTTKSDFVDSKDAVILKHVYSKWSKEKSDYALEDINLSVPKGKLVGVIGPVGAGKSSLLQTLLGELTVERGNMNVNGYYSYSAQEPWIFAATIRQNILFGEPFNKKRFNEVLKICALERDLEQFSQRDMTLVGDKGASLSGGQKARITLARAVYKDADIYLLDDPLSAVDVHVSKVLYENCINGFLKKKTRILVTHQVYYLKNADEIIILNNGRVEKRGKFNELANSDNEYAQLLTAEPEPEDEEGDKTEEKPKPDRKSESDKTDRLIRRRVSQISNRSRKLSTVSATSHISQVGTLVEDDSESEDEEDENQKGKGADESKSEKPRKPQFRDMQEESSKGKVKGSLLLKYLSAGTNIFAIMFLFSLYALTQLSGSGVDWFVSYWTNIEETRYYNITFEDEESILDRWGFDWSTTNCLYIYATGLICLFVFTLSRSLTFYSIALKCSRNLHGILFEGVIGATMRFFDTNPSGRILNRFSKDIGSVDEMLPRMLMDVAMMFLQIIGSLTLVVTINPYPLILLVFIVIALGFMRHTFLKSSRNIKRLEGMMKSPVFTHITSTLEGLTTVRALRAEKALKAEFDKAQDYHSSAFFMQMSCGSAYGFCTDQFGTVFIGFLTFTLIYFGDTMGWTGGQVGLAISQASRLMGLVNFSMRMSAALTNQLMSVERCLEYNTLPREPQPEITAPPPKNWPTQGEIQLQNVCMRYFDDGPLVLKDLTLTIRPKEKIGIVGRTGAGKSSLIAAMFRLAIIEGKIKIDGIDTATLSLESLRSKISIIPQDPVLFSGTLRYNLDPFDEYSDDVLYKALEEVELKDPANIINRLENKVTDKGSNYSVGQRQLICLARAIIRNNRILMLDEATANVDPQTDALIQKTIRQKFADCTVLTVAHRLNTIMDSDRVLVIDFGNVAEYEHPYLLLQNPNSIFCRMVIETGPTESEQLIKVAAEHYHSHSKNV